MLTRVQATYQEFPREYWILVAANFIDGVGGTMLFPFFSLYVTEKFDVGMTQVGVLFAVFSVSGFAGSMLGGALADRFGRRSMILFGLVFSAMSSLAMGLVDDLYMLYALALVAGLLLNIADPARQAMVADLLPEEKRAEGFGMMRVAANLAWIVGPTVGGLLAAQSYLILFILDAITSLITAVIVYNLVPESKPAATEGQEQESFLSTLAGYRVVFADKMYIAFLFISILMLIPYQQIYTTLSVYLRDVHDVPAQGYGILMSINAAIVVALQFWVTRRFSKYPAMLVMALGTLFYMVGLTMYGFAAAYGLFIAAMIIITFGEMIVVPVGQALAANFAPPDMRGRYMALFGLSWAIPSAVGTWAAGLIVDNYDPNWVWYLSGIISAVAAAGFIALFYGTRTRLASKDPVAQSSAEAA